MGQYHYLINLDKKQFVYPHQIGNGLKLKEQVGWRYSTSTALVMLLSACSKDGGRGGGDFHAVHPLVGSWAGDRIAFVGDYAEPEDIPGENAPGIYEECKAANASRGQTSAKAEGQKPWTDISPEVRAMMSAEFGIRYVGDGWLDIIEEKAGRAAAKTTPDLVAS
jgi:hypothetical protein